MKLAELSSPLPGNGRPVDAQVGPASTGTGGGRYTGLTQPVNRLEDIATPITAPVIDGPPDIIPGLLPRRGQLVIAGETNIGKSLVALEICSSLVSGEALWGELKPTLQARRILYILGEHYNEVIQRLWQVTKLPMTDEVFLLGPEQVSYDKWLVTQGRVNQQAVSKFMKWSEGVDLIVFDPFSAFVTGVDVENDNIQMRLVLDTMSLIAQSAGAACLVLAHQGKPQMDKYGNEHARKAYAIRGASAIEDAATNIFYLGRTEGQSAAAAGAEKVFELKCRKYKGAAPDKYTLMRNQVTLCHTLLGNRPFVEVQKIETQAMVARLQVTMPELTYPQLLKAVASMKGCSEQTVRNHLGYKDSK